MIVVDTSVWIDHFRKADRHLVSLLDEDAILLHPFVLGELAIGNLHPRADTLNMLQRIPPTAIASDVEFLHLVERNRLFALGIGFVDTHLLATARIMTSRLWTHDKRLHAVAEKLGLAYSAAN